MTRTLSIPQPDAPEEGSGLPGFYAPRLRPEEVADLVALAGEVTLHDEIALVRVALRRLLQRLDDDEEAAADGGKSSGRRLDIGRAALLIFQGSRTVARLLHEQRALSAGTAAGVFTVMNLALDELSVELEVRL